MAQTIVRDSSFSDIPSILKLLYDLGRLIPKSDIEKENFEKLIKEFFIDTRKKILVAETDNIKIIGLVSIMFLSRLNQNALEMYIPELIIDKDYRNMGIGRQLINSCIVLAKNKKCHRIRLESANHRIDSHLFYKHMGFEQSAFSFTLNLIPN